MATKTYDNRMNVKTCDELADLADRIVNTVYDKQAGKLISILLNEVIDLKRQVEELKYQVNELDNDAVGLKNDINYLERNIY